MQNEKIYFCKQYEIYPVPAKCFTKKEIEILTELNEQIYDLIKFQKVSKEIEKALEHYVMEIKFEIVLSYFELSKKQQYPYKKVINQMIRLEKLNLQRSFEWLVKEKIYKDDAYNDFKFISVYEKGKVNNVKSVYNSLGDTLTFDDSLNFQKF